MARCFITEVLGPSSNNVSFLAAPGKYKISENFYNRDSAVNGKHNNQPQTISKEEHNKNAKDHRIMTIMDIVITLPDYQVAPLEFFR